MRRTTILLVAVAAMAVLVGPTSPAAGQTFFPDVIQLPPGWQPEGIAPGRGPIMYSGSRADGDVVAVNLLTGALDRVVDAPPGRTAIGLELDRFGRLWVSGGGTGQVYVYDAATGEPVETFQLGTPPATFINDVAITRDAAYFTDSQQPVLYRIPIARNGEIGEPEVLPLTGEYEHQPGFNLNGIDVALGGRWLVAVQSNTGNLYRIDPETGEATLIEGVSVPAGDGILVRGLTIYVVQNQLNQVAVVRVNPFFTEGEVVDVLTSPNFDVPTTVAPFGNRLYLVNARFTTPPTPTTPYTMVAIPRG